MFNKLCQRKKSNIKFEGRVKRESGVVDFGQEDPCEENP